MKLLLLQKLKTQINHVPTIAVAHRIYQASQAADDTIFGYNMAEKEPTTQELEEAMAEKEDTKPTEAKG